MQNKVIIKMKLYREKNHIILFKKWTI